MWTYCLNALHHNASLGILLEMLPNLKADGDESQGHGDMERIGQVMQVYVGAAPVVEWKNNLPTNRPYFQQHSTLSLSLREQLSEVEDPSTQHMQSSKQNQPEMAHTGNAWTCSKELVFSTESPQTPKPKLLFIYSPSPSQISIQIMNF